MQPVGTDDDVEPAWRRVLERHLAVGGDGRDRVAEEVLDVVAAGVVVGLTEVVAHDLHVPVGPGGDDFGEVDAGRAPHSLAIHRQPVGAGGECLDPRQHAHLFRDLHRRPEQVDRMAAGLSQRGRAFDDGDVEPVPGEPVRQYRAGDAGPGDENPHEDLPDYLKLGKPNTSLTYR